MAVDRVITCPRCGETVRDNRFAISKPKLLIVEGRDEEEFFVAILKTLDITDVQVLAVGGKTKIRSNLKALRNDSRFSTVISFGIVRDADREAATAFVSVRDALREAGFPYPSKPLRQSKGPPKVNVMILPPDGQHGSLENVCLETVKDDPAMFCVEQYFDCLNLRGLNRRMGPDFVKAKTRVFLASREDPTVSLGVAVNKGYWPLDAQVLNTVKQFLQTI
ncbi:MAG: hypothetical protein A4E62_02370 [Syntrophorhabdus sp. PtaU1.Bin002]|nr:MAG: hypothetical protein A4E58_00082 [Syntrophorhabdus sp. PtaB.Bin006]OPY67016.1 MAG: hypothetical protein A4E62_02370 [Syntrophorhabdus sp. PtaU1.Bin002]